MLVGRRLIAIFTAALLCTALVTLSRDDAPLALLAPVPVPLSPSPRRSRSLLEALTPAPPSAPSPNVCDAAGVAAAADAARAWARSARHSSRSLISHTLTLSSLYALHPCLAGAHVATRAEHFAVSIMGSAAERERLVAHARSWGSVAVAAGAHVFYFSDEDEGALGGAPALVRLNTSAALDPTLTGAQHRSLQGLQHVLKAAPHARWYLMADDDTLYDIENAAAVVRHIESSVPVIVGHQFRGHMRWSGVYDSHPSGGGGMLLSAAAAHAISAALYSDECPFDRANDLTVARCAYALDIPRVHHHGWQPDWDAFSYARPKALRSFSEMGGAVTYHRLLPFSDVEEVVHQLGAQKRAPPEEQFSWQGRR